MYYNMPKSKFYKITILSIITIAAVIAVTYSCTRSNSNMDYKDHIEKYTMLLKKDPKNCHYLSQLANGYQAINSFDESILYYNRVLEFCPEDLLSMFQLGVSYFMIMERDKALKYMNKAIEGAKQQSNTELEKMFVDSKKDWLNKWDSVKSMKWNEGKTE